MRSWKPRTEILLLLIFNWFTQLYGQIDWKHQQEFEVEVELRWIFQLVQSFHNFMAVIGAKLQPRNIIFVQQLELFCSDIGNV